MKLRDFYMISGILSRLIYIYQSGKKLVKGLVCPDRGGRDV